jgi:hypothetical protein
MTLSKHGQHFWTLMRVHMANAAAALARYVATHDTAASEVRIGNKKHGVFRHEAKESINHAR